MTLYFLYYFLIHPNYHFLMDNTQTEQQTQQLQDDLDDLVLELNFDSLDTKKGYIYNGTLVIDLPTPESILPPVYFMEIFMTEYETYYIILDYEITHSILESYKAFYQNNNVLPPEIVDLISYNLFGYYNLTETLFNPPEQQTYQEQQIQQQKTLLKQYIIDRKCKIAYKADYYNYSIRILDNQNMYDLCLLEEIYKHYTTEREKGMFYWITVDNLDIDTAEEAEDAEDTLIN